MPGGAADPAPGTGTGMLVLRLASGLGGATTQPDTAHLGPVRAQPETRRRVTVGGRRGRGPQAQAGDPRAQPRAEPPRGSLSVTVMLVDLWLRLGPPSRIKGHHYND
jgi:hypothetical protein